MKALSIRQPWTHAVLYYGKSIENRRWNTSFRGEFLIHAAKGMIRDEYLGAEDFIADALGWTVGGSSALADRAAFEADFKARGQRGGIVGSAWLVGVIPPCAMGPSLFTADCSHKWHIPEQWGFVLEGVRPLPFVQWTGERGFFEVPDDYVERAARGESGKKPRRVQP